MTPRKYTYYVVFLLCCLYTSSLVKGQGTCSGSALAPVFSQTFGQGGSSSSKTSVPSGFTTNYSFQSSGALNDGSYIVTPRVQNSGRNDWAQGSDHTGNSNGNMFLVNAGTGGSVFFTQQVDNLCPGSTYNFSAWLANVNTTSNTLPICGSGYVYPNVRFNIKNTSGTILATYSTGNLPLTANTSVAPNWQQYGFSFALPSGTTSLVLEMLDAYGGLPQCGNDLAIDDILFTACTPTASINFTTASTVCSGTNTTITSSIVNSPFTNAAYQWQKSTNGGTTWTNIGTPGTSAANFDLNSVSFSDAAMYRVIVGPDVASLSSNTCVTASSAISLSVIQSPTASVSSPSPVCSGNTIQFTSTVTNDIATTTYNWTGPGGFASSVLNPTITNAQVAQSGTYTLLVTSGNNCTATSSTNITVNTTPTVAAITGSNGGCVGSTFTLSNATAGGTWSSSNPLVANIDNSGFVTLLQDGTTTISYTVTANGCSNTATKTISVASVSLAPSLIECNNGVRTYSGSSSDPYYVNYGNNSGGNTYLWTFTNTGTGLVETDVYKSGTDQNSRYPSVQLANGNIYNVMVQFTSNGVTCSAQHTVYKQVLLTGQIASAQDTTVCYTASNIPLRGSTSAVATSTTWRTLNGSGSFSSANTLNTTYTPSTADKTAGTVFIVFDVSTSLNMNGNCGSAFASDTMALHILPSNAGTNSTTSICSGTLFQHTSSSAVSGSTFSWTSTVLSGTGSGNTANGTGNISNTLTNSSATTDFVVRYTITPAYNGCTGVPYTVTVTVKPLPSLSITNNSSVICTGTITNITVSSSLSNTQYSWVSPVVSGTASGASANASSTTANTITDVLSNTGTTNAVVRYTITGVTTDGCINTAQTDVTVTPVPSAADAGSDQSHCNIPYINLNAQTPTVGTGTWSQVSGPGTVTFSDVNDPAATISGLTTGIYVFKWTVSNGSCTSTEDEVSVTIYAPTVAGTITGNNTVCASGNSGSISLTGNTGTTLNWAMSIDNGNSWNNISNTTNTLNYNNLTTTTLYRATVQNGICNVENTNDVTITVMQAVTTALAGNDQTLCATISATLAANQPVSGTGTWTQIAGPTTAGFVNVNAYNSVVNNLATGTYTFRWTISNVVCTDSYDEVSITINAATVAGTITADNTVCATGNSGTVSLTGNTGNILNWSISIDNGNNWNTISNTTNTLNYNNLTTTTLYRATVQNGICNVENTNNVTITVLQPPTTAIAGSDQTLNNVTTATLNGNNPVSGIGTWTQISGPTTAGVVNTNAHNTVVNNLSTGTYTFRWTITNGVCGSSFDEMILTIEPPTVPGTLSADATVCAVGGNGATLQLTGYTGSIVQWEFSVNNGSNWSTISNTTNQHSYSNLSTTTLYRALVQNGVGLALYSNTVTITVMPAVTVANAGNDQTLCATTSATLAANQPVSGTGTWTQIAGPTTTSFANINAYNSVVNNLATGTYTFRWTIANGVCADSYDEVSITIDAATVAGTITGNNTVCASGNSGSISLTGNTGAILNWAISIDNGNSWSNISNTTNTLNYNNLTTTTLYRATVQNGICNVENTNDVTITIMQAVTTALAGNDQTLCATTIATLAANQPVSGTGTWTQITGPTTASFVNVNAYNSVVNNLVTGTYTFRWTIANGVCADSYDEVTITINAATVAGIIAGNNTVCATGNSGSISLTGNTGAILNWAMSIDNGNSWNTISNTTTTLNYNNLTTTTLYRAAIQNGVCNVEHTNNVTITVMQAVTAALAGNDQTLCATTIATLAANQPVSGTGTWTQITGPTTASFVNVNAYNSVVNNLTTGTYTFRWTISNGVCADSYDEVTITIDAATVAGTIAGNNTVCATGNSGSISLTGNTGAILNWAMSIDNGNSWNTISNTTTTLNYNNLTTTTLYRATVQNGVCNVEHTNNVTITVDAITTPGVLNGAATVCNGSNSGTINLSGNNGTIIHWEYSVDGGNNWTIISNTANSYTFNNLTSNTLFRVLVQNGVCSNVYSNHVSIVLDPVTIPGTLTGNNTVCYGTNSGSLQVTGNNGTVQYWEYSTDGGNTWNNIAQTSTTLLYNNLTQSTMYRAVVRSGVCASATTNSITITVTALSVGGTVTGNNTVCSGNNNGLLTLTGNTGSVLEWQSSTDGGNTWTSITNTTANYTYSNITTTTQYRAVIQNGVCSAAYSSAATIVVDAVTVPGNIVGGGHYCSGNNNGNIILSGNNGNIVQWEVSTNNGSSWSIIAHTAGNYQYQNLTTTSQFRVLVQNGVCGAAYSNIVTVQISDVVVNTIAQNSYTVCDGQAVTINAAPATGGTGIYLYQWQHSPDGINWADIAGANAAGYSFTPTATVSMLRRVVSSLPCSQISNIVTVTKQAAISNNILSANTVICFDNTTQITGTLPTGGDGMYTYSWQFSTDAGTTWNNISGANGKDLTTTALTVPTLYRRIVRTILCTGLQENISNAISISIKYKPTAIFTVLPDTGCSPVIISFQNQSVGNNTLFLYSFGDGKDTLVNNRSDISHLYSTNSFVTLNTRLLAINDCGVDTAYKTVTIKPDNIQPNLLLSDSSLCGPGTIRFTNNTTGGLKYTWNFGDGTPVINNTGNATIEHQYTQPGTYQFTLIADNECSIKTIRHTIRIHPSAVAAFITNQPDYCVGDSVRFTNQSNHTNYYRWFFGNSDSANTVNPVSVYKQAGTFHATLIAGIMYAPDNKTCFDTASSTVTVVGTRKGTMQVNSLTGNCLPHTINALSLNTPASTVVWTWGDDSSSKGESASHRYFSNGQYMVTMVATSAGGCRFIDSTSIIVNGPTGSISFLKNDICLGQSVLFNANFSNNTLNPSDSIRWYPGDGSVITTNVSSFSYQFTKAGIYHPKAWLIKANGCMVPLTNTDSVRVDEVVARFGLSGTFECGSTIYRFTDSSTALSGIRNWKWVMNRRDSSYERNMIKSFSQRGAHSTALIVEGNSGCKAISEASYDVQVFQYPIANISAMAEACKTDLLELKSNVNSVDSVALRLWTLGNGEHIKDSVVKATFSKEGLHNFKLTVATVNNCYDSVYKQVTVHPLPTIAVQQNNTVCKGDSITIRANGASRYIWKDQYENIICTDCQEIKVKPSSSIGYKVIGYNQFGCSEIQSTTVRVVNPLRMLVSPGDTICQGESTTLFATGATSYQWLGSNGLNATLASNVSVKPTETTTFKVIGKDAFNCFADTANIKVVVGKPTVFTLGKDTTLTSGSTYQLRTLSASNDIVKWRWSGATGISCATCPTPVVKLSDDACISCTAINQYGCISSDTICIKTFCPATEVFVPNAFTPDGDGINDKLVVQGKGIRLIKSFRIFNRWGEVVFEKVNFNPGDPAYGWDGKVRGNSASPDVYVYVCEVICEKGLPSIFKGNTSILK